MERTPDGKFVLRTNKNTMLRIALIRLGQIVAKFAQFMLIILAVLLFGGVLFHIDAPRSYIVTWLSYVGLAALASYACRQIVSYLQQRLLNL